jgi:frataxin-like iron-binding protein CyaY
MTKAINNVVTTKIPAIQSDISGNILTITFSHGKELVLDASTLSEDIQQAAMMSGLRNKLVDGAAISRNTETGASATIQDKFEAVQDISDRLTSVNGTWNAVRAAGEGTSGSGLLLRALMKMTGKTKTEIDAFLGKKSTAEKNALRKNPKVAAIIATMQEAKIDKSIDTDALLAEVA